MNAGILNLSVFKYSSISSNTNMKRFFTSFSGTGRMGNIHTKRSIPSSLTWLCFSIRLINQLYPVTLSVPAFVHHFVEMYIDTVGISVLQSIILHLRPMDVLIAAFSPFRYSARHHQSTYRGTDPWYSPKPGLRFL